MSIAHALEFQLVRIRQEPEYRARVPTRIYRWRRFVPLKPVILNNNLKYILIIY